MNTEQCLASEDETEVNVELPVTGAAGGVGVEKADLDKVAASEAAGVLDWDSASDSDEDEWSEWLVC